MKKEHLRVLATRKRDADFLDYNIQDLETLGGVGESEIVRQRVTAAVREALMSSRKKDHDHCAGFVGGVGDHAAKMAVYGAGTEPAFESWGALWEKRYIAAIQAVEQLGRSLGNMGDDERRHWVPPHYVARSAGFDDTESQRKAMEDWLTISIAIADYFETEQERISNRTTIADALCEHVWLLAYRWVDCFQEIPGASDNSPFVNVVHAYVTSIYPESKPPAHQNIRDSLSRITGKLAQRLEKKTTE